MNNTIIRKSVIIAVALSGVFINTVYSFNILKAFFDPLYDNAVREIMISAVVLEIGWISLLCWVIVKPFQGRHILLFTIVPVLLGNILHSVSQFMAHSGNASAITLNVTSGLLYSGFYVVAFMVGKGESKKV
jgi:hypothetical protein